MDMLQILQDEVSRLADEGTPDLLPALLSTLLKGDRPGLINCDRHTLRLFPYVQSQIALTRAKRNLYQEHSRVDWTPAPSHGPVDFSSKPETNFELALVTRDAARRTYRSTPCTCWVLHR
jgi:hypothetical protein